MNALVGDPSETMARIAHSYPASPGGGWKRKTRKEIGSRFSCIPRTNHRGLGSRLFQFAIGVELDASAGSISGLSTRS